MIYDAAVVIPTVLRPVLKRAVRSVFAQDFPGTVQVLVGIDIVKGERAILDELRAECPERMVLTVFDLGYSTSTRNGGYYNVWGGGALRTILSFAANSQYVAYLDDDNWWAPNHLSSLRAAIEGHDWAYAYRWYVDPDTQEPLCVDRWESLGPGRGMYAKAYNGFVDANCYFIDKKACHWALPAWSLPHRHSLQTRGGGAGEDRTVFEILSRKYRGACSELATVYYVMVKDSGPWRGLMRLREEKSGLPAELMQPLVHHVP